jgi:hypothetical protein
MRNGDRNHDAHSGFLERENKDLAYPDYPRPYGCAGPSDFRTGRPFTQPAVAVRICLSNSPGSWAAM